MTVNEQKAKSLLIKHKKVNSWFVNHYGMNLYRGCNHNCIYCDGRAENYYVKGDFAKDITVKTNALKILEKELILKTKKNQIQKHIICIGGGVSDSYQTLEKKYQLTRGVLNLLLKYKTPVHIITKSTLILRDIDLLKQINNSNKVLVSFSFSTDDESISNIFEPGVPSPERRFEAIRELKESNISCGITMMPVIPYITDSINQIESLVLKAANYSVDYIIFSGMTLKEGRQKNLFLKILNNYKPALLSKYQQLYGISKWGEANSKYYNIINQRFHYAIKKHKVPCRIPIKLIKPYINKRDILIIMLEYIDYILKLKNKKTSFGYTAYNLSKINKPLIEIKDNINRIKGINEESAKVIKDYIHNNCSQYFEELVENYLIN